MYQSVQNCNEGVVASGASIAAHADVGCAHWGRQLPATTARRHSLELPVFALQAEATRFSTLYAPEHLIVNTSDAEDWLPELDNAGSVFLGRWTPESVGDYASGTNHVLPT